MATQGAQYIFRVHKFDTMEAMNESLMQMDPADRPNAVQVPGCAAYMMLAGNMQHIPLDRLNIDDVYRDVQEVKQEAAEWVSKTGLVSPVSEQA